MKKVLHILPSLELGGTEAFIMNHYRCLNHNEMQFDFLVFYQKEWHYLGEIERLGGKVFYATKPSLLHVGGFLKCMKRALSEGGPYVAIHCHADAGNAIPLLCGMLCGVEMRIAHSHSVDIAHPRFLKRILTSVRKSIIKYCATEYWACSAAAGETFFGKRLFSTKGTIIKNGIHVDNFLNTKEEKIEKLRLDFGIEDKEIIVGNISRFDANKNQLYIVDVFKNLVDKYPNSLLLLGGVDGGMLDEVEDYVSVNHLDSKVRFIGKRVDVAECLKLIDVFLLPSVHEGLGIALLEAQAAGCLCFASTGVPHETDMELGTAHYLNLSDGAAYWAEYISKEIDARKIPTEASIRKVFKEKAFDVKESCKELVKYYG